MQKRACESLSSEGTRSSEGGSVTDQPTGVPTAPEEPIPVKRGKIKFYSERDEPRPWNNCLICSAMTVLRWMGYVLPAGYDDVIRAAIPLPNDGRGTAMFEVLRAIATLVPIKPTLETLAEADFLAALKPVGGRGRGKSAFAVVVNTAKLPVHFQRLVGQGYDGLHGLAVVAKTPDHSQVYILDPMGKSQPGKGDDSLTFVPYAGELIAWADLKPALVGAPAGSVKVIRGAKSAARTPVAP